jgi:diadenylate cyclase
MIEWLWDLLSDLGEYYAANFDPVRDIVDIAIVGVAVYWVLMMLRGTRAIQILLGLVVLGAAAVFAQVFQLLTVSSILGYFLAWSPIIIIVLFQHDIRRALARVGRGFFPAMAAERESQVVEEVVRAAQVLSQKRVGALFVLERETGLEDQIEAGTPVDAEISKELLVSLFLPYSPLHDGAVVIQKARIAYAGSILPLTLKTELPEGVGTRHRAAVGITEETDAVVVVVSEETAGISFVMSGEIAQNLTAPRLREVLSEVLGTDRRDMPSSLLTTAEGPAAAREGGAVPAAAREGSAVAEGVREDGVAPEAPDAAHARSTG